MFSFFTSYAQKAPLHMRPPVTTGCKCLMRLVLFAESNPADYASKLKRLPQNLQESVESLSGDKVLHELIGDKLVKAAIAIRKVSIVSYPLVLLFFFGCKIFWICSQFCHFCVLQAEIDHYAKNPGAFNDLIYRY